MPAAPSPSPWCSLDSTWRHFITRTHLSDEAAHTKGKATMSVVRDTKLSTWKCEETSTSKDLPRRRQITSFSLCRFATARGKFVRSLQQEWQVSFENDVDILSSNSDGSILVVVTSNGEVSLLRGSDGTSLGTRRLPPSASSFPVVSWPIHQNDGEYSATGSLLITSAMEHDDGTSTVLTLVRNLRSSNHTTPPQISTVTVPDLQVKSICGQILTEEGKVRLVGCSEEDKLFSFYWDYVSNQPEPITYMDSSCYVDGRVGLYYQRTSDREYYVCHTYSERSASIEWLDVTKLERSSRFMLSPSSRTLALEPLQSTSPETLAVAAVVTSPTTSTTSKRLPAIRTDMTEKNSTTSLLVLQVLVDETMGLVVLSKPHVLYSIPIDKSCCRVELAAPHSYPLWFHFKVWHEEKNLTRVDHMRFSPPPQSCRQLSEIMRLLELGQIQQAEKIMLESGEPISQEHSCVSPCDIPLRHLCTILSDEALGTWEESRFEQVQHCWIRILDGARHATKRSMQAVLEAVDATVGSLRHATSQDADRLLSLTLSMVKGLMESQLVSESEIDKTIAEKCEELENRVSVVRFLSSFVNQTDNAAFSPSDLRSFKSISHLYVTLVKEQKFVVAEMVWRHSEHHRRQLTPHALVAPILKIPPEVPPQEYSNLLEEVVLPCLSINHEGLRLLKTWACRTADEMDELEQTDSAGLESAMALLEVMDRSCKRLQLRVHTSFATSGPFVERPEGSMGRNIITSSLNNSNTSFSSLRPAFNQKPDARTPTRSISQPNQGHQPKPTLLSLGALRKGAAKTVAGTATLRLSDDSYDTNDDCVAEKLWDTRCLLQARLNGLPRQVVSLRRVRPFGGVQSIAKGLIGVAIDRHGGLADSFSRASLVDFCATFSVDFDLAALEYVEARCKEKVERSLAEKAIKKSAMIARNCLSDLMKTKATLHVLRAALFHGFFPDWLGSLSREAMTWSSSDSGIQSEVEEVSRLISIHSVIITYCGREARELFRVDNPRHAYRLLMFVTQQSSKESALRDALFLCDAFSHLSSRDACSWILHNAILNHDRDSCARAIRGIYSCSSSLAELVLVGVVSFAEELLLEASKPFLTTMTLSDDLRNKAKAASDCVITAISTLQEHARVVSDTTMSQLAWLPCCGSLESLKTLFQQIQLLQMDFDVYVSLSDLCSPSTMIKVASLLFHSIVTIQNRVQVSKTIAIAKKACALLLAEGKTTEFEDFWTAVLAEATFRSMKDPKDGDVLDFMKQVGLLNYNLPPSVIRTYLSVALALISDESEKYPSSAAGLDLASRIVLATYIGRDRALPFAKGNELPSICSFGTSVEIACEILSRCDEGVGEWLAAQRQKIQRQGLRETQESQHPAGAKLLKSYARLHPTWYVGDGLLLPPRQAVSHIAQLCRSNLQDPDESQLAMDFLRRNGANFLSLRVLCCSFSNVAGSKVLPFENKLVNCEDFALLLSEAFVCLSERSLGGSQQVGLTSGDIDSQLATSFLLSLPAKRAASTFSASLPSALKSRGFNRVRTLAHIGIATSTNCSNATDGFRKVGWKEQKRFHDQCQNLAIKAFWCERLKLHGVEFDFAGFDFLHDTDAAGDQHIADTSSEATYALSLLPLIVERLSRKMDINRVLQWSIEYTDAFRISKGPAIQAVTEWCLLSPVQVDRPTAVSLFCLEENEVFVRSTIRTLVPLRKRYMFLRRCLITLESSPAGVEYERFSLLLDIYHETLLSIVDQSNASEFVGMSAVEDEMDLIDRRRDVLSILTSFFMGSRHKLRPSFPSFFVPLENSNGASHSIPICGILGKIDDNSFDPLEPLVPFFEKAVDKSILSALSPMCVSLGLPMGYMHARFLISRFQPCGEKEVTTLPSYENDVVPTLSRIRSASDRSLLAEWCSEQYKSDEEVRLKCLDDALQAAMKASTEIEHHRLHDAEAEEQALATVKRLSSEKASLSDVLTTKRILRGVLTMSSPGIATVGDKFFQVFEEFLSNNPFPLPEALIDFLLSSGSLLAANACLDSQNPLSSGHLRKWCSIVKEACSALMERHSHINYHDRCKQFANEWLFHGETINKSARIRDGKGSRDISLSVLDNDFTSSFTIDLNGLQDGARAFFSQEVFNVSRLDWKPYTSEEESSAICRTSARELSEVSSLRSAIRIAFVLSLSEECDAANTENSTSTANQALPKISGSIFSKLESKRDSRSEKKVFEHCRELLGIVFSNPSFTAPRYSSNPNVSASHTHDTDCNVTGQSTRTLTFAMRHRAFRTLSILCPQEAIERAMVELRLLPDNVAASIFLNNCSFGVFVAKEIEEMGLPLPHSDLGQLSSIHFPSYARSLWRDYRDKIQAGNIGRFLLLLVDMCIRGETLDVMFVESLLEEMLCFQLPRSVLAACESLASVTTPCMGNEDVDHLTVARRQLFGKALSVATNSILTELRLGTGQDSTQDADTNAACLTVSRLGAVVSSLPSVDSTYLRRLIDELQGLARSIADKKIREQIQRVTARLQRLSPTDCHSTTKATSDETNE